jgi:hypothetical protein
MTVTGALGPNPMDSGEPRPLAPSTHASSVSPTSFSRPAKTQSTEEQRELRVCVCVGWIGDDRLFGLRDWRKIRNHQPQRI